MTVSETFHPALRVFQPAWNDMGIPLRGELFYLERKFKRCGSVLWLKIFIEVCDLRFKPRVIQACILFSDCKGVREYIQNRSTYFVLFSY